MIGLYSPNGPNWANMGRSLIRGILNSARGISDKDNSLEAQARRRIAGFHELDGLEFVARIDVGTDTLIGTQITANNGTNDGAYDFTNLAPGRYLVDVTDTGGALTGLTQTFGTDPHDITLTAGQDYNDADFGYVGGAPGKINLYVGKECVKYNVPSSEALDRLIDLIKEHGKWVEPGD
jgi:hypothetical protein